LLPKSVVNGVGEDLFSWMCRGIHMSADEAAGLEESNVKHLRLLAQ